MRVKEFIEDNRYKIQFIIAVLAVAISFATIREGFYVDENGLLTIYKGIYQGQRMFVDSWESLQTGTLVVYPLLALYFGLLRPALNAIGVGYVLYMRIAYQLIRLLLAVYLYFTLRKSSYKNGAFAASLFYYMFVVAFDNFSYKSICDMALMLIICFVFRYHQTERPWYWILVGIAACAAILAYPTMIFMALVLGILLIYAIYRYDVPKSILLAFVVTCLACGALTIIYLQATSGLGNVFSQIGNLGDQDYDASLPVRLLKMLAHYLIFAVVAYIPVVAMRLVDKKRQLEASTEHIVLTLYWLAIFAGLCLVRLSSVSTSRFVYGFLILFFWFPHLMRERPSGEGTKIGYYRSAPASDKWLLWTIFILSAAAQLIWSCSTNQDISVPGHMAIFVVVADILLFAEEDNYMPALTGIILAVDFFFMGFWVSESNGGYSDILETRYYVTEGELSGMALEPDAYWTNYHSYNLVSQYLSASDKLLVAFGSNSTGYINSDAIQGTYTVYARTQLNDKLLTFYQVNPDRQADYVIIDTANAKYADFCQGATGQWILSTYTTTVAQEGSLVLLSK